MTCFTRSYELHKRFGEFSFLIMESLYIYFLDIINLPDLVYKFCLEVDEGMEKKIHLSCHLSLDCRQGNHMYKILLLHVLECRSISLIFWNKI